MSSFSPHFAMRTTLCMLCLSLAIGCEPTQRYTEPAASVSVAPSQPRTAEADTPNFIVHEWGTFTSMQSSSGETLVGMYEEDEPLPEFVHRYQIPTRRPRAKGMELSPSSYTLLAQATQRLETPVLYFYGASPPSKVSVKVDFPEGIISEWYPDASIYSPSPRRIQTIQQGSMTWMASLHDRAAQSIPVSSDDIWAPSRRVDALTVKVDDEEEPFIFYRGVGTFTLPITVQSEQTGTLKITNTSDAHVPQAFLYKNMYGRRSIYPLGPLAEQASVEHGGIFARPSPKEGPAQKQVSTEELKTPLITALIKEGLYPKEARAMVDTWERSYFDTPGIRVLYIVPRAWTDKLLPITIEPSPDELVRVLIGRIEVRSTAQELGFEGLMRGHFEHNTSPDMTTLGPFLIARIKHLQDKAQKDGHADFASWLDTLAQQHHAHVPVLETALTPRAHTP